MTEIAIIGPRGSGKTTYLAALAHLSKEKIFPDLHISILKDQNTETLVDMGSNLIKLGEIIGETKVGNEPTYGFTIDIPARKYGAKKPEKIQLSFVDYAGQIFENIARRNYESTIRSYINQILKVEAWMVMLTDF
ncbi:MAG: ATP-binding protein [Trichodesmium sp. MAG_R03]|nr:ATP-binding protein [Trichodesmium sp. MAG_R03]